MIVRKPISFGYDSGIKNRSGQGLAAWVYGLAGGFNFPIRLKKGEITMGTLKEILSVLGAIVVIGLLCVFTIGCLPVLWGIVCVWLWIKWRRYVSKNGDSV